jgi:hypothetical protein
MRYQIVIYTPDGTKSFGMGSPDCDPTWVLPECLRLMRCTTLEEAEAVADVVMTRGSQLDLAAN